MSDSNLHPILSEMAQILSTLGNKDALQLFYTIKRGIGSSTRIIRELDLSQKQYYTRLNQLLKAGLIEKTGKIYRHTMFGSACYRLGEAFHKILNNRDYFDMLTRLKNVDELNSAEKKKVAEALSIETLGLSNILSPVIMVDDFENLVRETVSLLKKAESEVYFATQYIDAQVIEEVLKGIKRKIKFNILCDFKGSFYKRLNMLMKMMFSLPKMLPFFYEWLKSNQIRSKIIDLPYTFIIVDGNYALVELKSHEDNFSLAFIFENRNLCSKLIDKFNAMWDSGSEFDLGKSLVDSLWKKDYKDLDPYEKVKVKSDLLKRNAEAPNNH